MFAISYLNTLTKMHQWAGDDPARLAGLSDLMIAAGRALLVAQRVEQLDQQLTSGAVEALIEADGSLNADIFNR